MYINHKGPKIDPRRTPGLEVYILYAIFTSNFFKMYNFISNYIMISFCFLSYSFKCLNFSFFVSSNLELSAFGSLTHHNITDYFIKTNFHLYFVR